MHLAAKTHGSTISLCRSATSSYHSAVRYGLWGPIRDCSHVDQMCIPSHQPARRSWFSPKGAPSQQEAYRLTFGTELEGAHYAEADERALSLVIEAQPTLLATRLLAKGVQTWQELHGKKEKKRSEYIAETEQPEPKPWKGGEAAETVKDKPYSGPSYGPAREAAQPRSPVLMYLLFFPVALLKKIAALTNKYAVQDWVINTNESGKGRPVYRNATTGDPKHKCRHRHETKSWVTVTHWSLLCFMGVLIARGCIWARVPVAARKTGAKFHSQHGPIGKGQSRCAMRRLFGDCSGARGRQGQREGSQVPG